MSKTLKNPKTNETLTSELSLTQVLHALKEFSPGTFGDSLLRQFQAKQTLSEAQWFWAFKLAEEKINPPKPSEEKQDEGVRLKTGFCEWLFSIGVPRLMWRIIDEDKTEARIKLYFKEQSNKIDVVFSGGDLGRRVGIIQQDKFFPNPRCPETVKIQLILFSKYRKVFMTMYGKKFGRCFVCGRELENEESVEKGIGPICEGRL